MELCICIVKYQQMNLSGGSEEPTWRKIALNCRLENQCQDSELLPRTAPLCRFSTYMPTTPHEPCKFGGPVYRWGEWGTQRLGQLLKTESSCQLPSPGHELPFSWLPEPKLLDLGHSISWTDAWLGLELGSERTKVNKIVFILRTHSRCGELVAILLCLDVEKQLAE